VPDATLDGPVGVFAREFLGIGTRVRMRRTVGITFERDGGNSDDRTFGEPLFQIVICPLAVRQCDSPALIMNHDADVIRVLERCCTALERCIIELPLRRREPPDKLRDRARWPNSTDTTIRARTFGGNGILPDSWLPIR
jgi:hypothetical protein